jgi:spore maturation protein CgeB
MSMKGERNLILFGLRMRTEAYRDAFETLGYETASDVLQPTSEQLSRSALCFISLYDGVRRPWETLRLKRPLAHAGVPLIGIDRDAPWHLGVRVLRLRSFAWLKVLDIYATHTLQPTYDFAPVKHYVPNAVWTRNFNLHGRTLEEMRDPAFYRWDVSFVGNLDGARYKEHAERQRFFAALAPRLEALGLRVLFRHSSGMSEAEQIEVIQRSVINLTYRSSCDHRSRSGVEMSWGLPERCYGVPARGGFVLSDERRHAADDFDLAREWASYRDFEDCIARIRHFIAHFPETRAIAEAAHARVMREHTYQHRAQLLLRIADEWRSAKSVLS